MSTSSGSGDGGIRAKLNPHCTDLVGPASRAFAMCELSFTAFPGLGLHQRDLLPGKKVIDIHDWLLLI